MDDADTVREVIERHRTESGLAADGGVSDRWVVLRLGRIPMPFLNTSARRKALAAHDVNHLVAGVSTGNTGEAEISAWELASGGCGKYPAAWMLDLAGMLLGMVWPIKVTKAFAAGRRMKNAYAFDLDEILSLSMMELHQHLARPDGRSSYSTVGSVAVFVGYLLLAIPVGTAFLLIMILSIPVWTLTNDWTGTSWPVQSRGVSGTLLARCVAGADLGGRRIRECGRQLRTRYVPLPDDP